MSFSKCSFCSRRIDEGDVFYSGGRHGVYGKNDYTVLACSDHYEQFNAVIGEFNPEHLLKNCALKIHPAAPVGMELAGYEGAVGFYYTKLLAVANGEQSIEPIYRVKKS